MLEWIYYLFNNEYTIEINVKNIPTLSVIRVPNIQLWSLSVLLNSILLISISFLTRATSLLTEAISDFNSVLTFSILLFKLFSTLSILLSRSLISDFKLASTLSILLSSSLNLLSILLFKLFSTLSILLSSSLNLLSILLSSSLNLLSILLLSSVWNALRSDFKPTSTFSISDFKLASTFASLMSKFSLRYSISL
ncbi:hypothetical protein bmLB2001_001308 (plasmid) [Borrelia miyamotoi]|nr:hypothetical protein bmLB2001_001308 [Borrelia miyamotoi]